MAFNSGHFHPLQKHYAKGMTFYTANPVFLHQKSDRCFHANRSLEFCGSMDIPLDSS